MSVLADYSGSGVRGIGKQKALSLLARMSEDTILTKMREWLTAQSSDSGGQVGLFATVMRMYISDYQRQY